MFQVPTEPGISKRFMCGVEEKQEEPNQINRSSIMDERREILYLITCCWYEECISTKKGILSINILANLTLQISCLYIFICFSFVFSPKLCVANFPKWYSLVEIVILNWKCKYEVHFSDTQHHTSQLVAVMVGFSCPLCSWMDNENSFECYVASNNLS